MFNFAENVLEQKPCSADAEFSQPFKKRAAAGLQRLARCSPRPGSFGFLGKRCSRRPGPAQLRFLLPGTAGAARSGRQPSGSGRNRDPQRKTGEGCRLTETRATTAGRALSRAAAPAPLASGGRRRGAPDAQTTSVFLCQYFWAICMSAWEKKKNQNLGLKLFENTLFHF